MINYIETHIVDHCNLKCRGCSHFSSIAREKIYNISEFTSEISRIKELGGVKTLRIMGGEPLMHPFWDAFCIKARQNLPEADVVIVTNGILESELIKHAKMLQEYRIKVCKSEYGVINKSFGVSETHDKRDLYNISLDISGKQDPEEAFEQCDLHQGHWNFLKEGKLYPCCVAANIDIFAEHFSLLTDEAERIEENGIDIYSHSLEEIEAFLNKPARLCRFCNTEKRRQSYKRFETSGGELSEWICL